MGMTQRPVLELSPAVIYRRRIEDCLRKCPDVLKEITEYMIKRGYIKK